MDDPAPAPYSERILHARAEVLLRHVVRTDLRRITDRGQLPLVLLDHDGGQSIRWLRAGVDAGLLAAIVVELEAAAVGCLLVRDRRPGAVVGTAITASGGGVRVLGLDAGRRRLGRPRITVGAEEEPHGTLLEVAAALQRAVMRASGVAAPRSAADPPAA